MVHGTKAHRKLQDFGDDEGSILEGIIEGDDVSETGIFDLLETEKGRTALVDYKTSGSYKVAAALGMVVIDEETGDVYKSGPRKGEKKTRKMLTQADAAIDRRDWELQLNKYRVELERRGHKVDDLYIQCIVRDGNTWIARSRGVARNLYYFPITRLPDKEVLLYFKRKREALLKALEVGHWTDPCNEHENWNGIRCTRYCEVAEHCPLGKYLRQERETETMPIKGLSNTRRLPRLGKIRLGIKAKTAAGKEYPKEVDYFILDPESPVPEERESLIAQFHELYGEQPKAIKVMLPVGDTDLVFPQFWKRYGSGTLLQCKGDGETATASAEEFTKGLTVTGKTEMGQPIVECLGEACPYAQGRKCARVATLQVLVPELKGAGVWQITTGSINSIINLNSGLDYITAVAGRFHMIPLQLERREQATQHQDKEGKRVKGKHYVLHLNMAIELAKLQGLAQIDGTKIMLELPEPVNGPEEAILDQTEDEIPVTAPGQVEQPTDFMGVIEALSGKGNVPLQEFGQWAKVRYKNQGVAFDALLPALNDETIFQGIFGEFNAWVDAQADKAAEESQQGTLLP
jgi:hypothetical protein